MVSWEADGLGCHVPVKSGLRFSRNAAIASLRSLLHKKRRAPQRCVIECFGGRHVCLSPQNLFRPLNHQRRVVGDRGRELSGVADQRLDIGHSLVGEADSLGFRHVDVPSRVHQLGEMAGGNQIRESLHRADIGDEAHAGLPDREDGVSGGDAHVAGRKMRSIPAPRQCPCTAAITGLELSANTDIVVCSCLTFRYSFVRSGPPPNRLPDRIRRALPDRFPR